MKEVMVTGGRPHRGRTGGGYRCETQVRVHNTLQPLARVSINRSRKSKTTAAEEPCSKAVDIRTRRRFVSEVKNVISFKGLG